MNITSKPKQHRGARIGSPLSLHVLTYVIYFKDDGGLWRRGDTYMTEEGACGEAKFFANGARVYRESLELIYEKEPPALPLEGGQ